MTAALTVVCVVLALVVVVAIWAVALYNGLVVLKNRFKNAYSQIDVQLKRRYDLIPNLVETAKGYLKHERETLTAVIEARNQAAGAAKALAAAPGDPTAVKAFSAAESGLAGVLSRLMVVVERYPDGHLLTWDGNCNSSIRRTSGAYSIVDGKFHGAEFLNGWHYLTKELTPVGGEKNRKTKTKSTKKK